LKRAVFLDRDGVINEAAPEGLYVTRWEDFHILPGVAEAIALLNRTDFSVIVVTNQRSIAKGLLTEADLRNIHQRMTGALKQAGAVIDEVYYCPHELEPRCDCRKPAPGMLLSAARSRGLELRASWMIGDSAVDVEAGKNAGCKTARLLRTNKNPEETARRSDADVIASSLLDAVRQILLLEQVAIGAHSTTPATT
jgi:D-glycero-D-manno-heptose 1,7-bisphosphate phosphatase